MSDVFVFSLYSIVISVSDPFSNITKMFILKIGNILIFFILIFLRYLKTCGPNIFADSAFYIVPLFFPMITMKVI